MPFQNGSALMYNMGSLTMFNRIRNFKPSGAAPRGRTRCGPCCDPKQANLKDARAFVLCCMDFRLRDCQICQLNRKGYKNDYDEVIAAGASLGYNGLLEYDTWKTYIDEHFELGYLLHHISEIIIIDHDKCGAYSAEYPGTSSSGGIHDANDNVIYELEREKHIENLTTCVNDIWTKYSPGGSGTTIPDLKVKGYLISIDGSVLELIHSRE